MPLPLFLEVWLLQQRTRRTLVRIQRAVLRQRTEQMRSVVREARSLGLAA